MFYGSFFSHLHDVTKHTVRAADVAREARLTIIIGIMFGFAPIGLALTLLPRARAAGAL